MRIIIPIVICIFLSTQLKAQPDSILPATTPTKTEVYNRGLTLYKTNHFHEAILSFDSCLVLDSTFADARFAKALSLQKKGDLKTALKELEYIKGNHPGYDHIDKRIKSYYLTVYISKNWYYMLALLLLTILIMAVIAKSIAYKKS